MKKKVLALVMALVLVLSMTSALAVSACNWAVPSWTNTTADLCGRGKVEVVPLVKVNTSCGVEYQPSTCATAMKQDKIYLAIKLTVEKNPDPAWWEQAELSFDFDGILSSGGNTTADIYNLNGQNRWEENYVLDFSRYIQTDADGEIAILSLNGLDIDWDANEEEVYYLNPSWTGSANDGFIEADDAEFAFTGAKTPNVVFEADTTLYTSCDDPVKVCVTLASEYDGYTLGAVQPYNRFGDYYFNFAKEYPPATVADANNFTKGKLTGSFQVWTQKGATITNRVAFDINNGAIEGFTLLNGSDNAFYAQVLKDFGLANCGTDAVFTDDNIQANFGWDDEQESCYSWSDKGTAVVDPQCVVEIPKTGDVSVIAYAVMALVAAAGAMGLKK